MRDCRKTYHIIFVFFAVSILFTGIFGIPQLTQSKDTYTVFVTIINQPPETPYNPNPTQNQTDISINPTLQVTVFDLDNDQLNVTFYQKNGNIIGYQYNVSSGETISVTWSDLSYTTTYSWYVIVNDSEYETISELWSFTTGSPSTNPPPSGNLPPHADASASETLGYVYESLLFDASKSYDSDGDIIEYIWDFGKGSSASTEITTNSFSSNGTYIVTLTVTDNDGASDTDTLMVNIVAGNIPPTQPLLQGPTRGHKNTSQSFTIQSNDQDNDTLQYMIEWGDTTTTTTEFFEPGVPVDISHQWKSYGIYEIVVYAYDGNTASETNILTIYIDVLPINETEFKGLLIDENSNDIYNLFENTNTGMITVTKLDNETYLIDINNDGHWDYAYNMSSGVSLYCIFLYNKYLALYRETPGFEIVFLLVLISVIAFIYKRKK